MGLNNTSKKAFGFGRFHQKTEHFSNSRLQGQLSKDMAKEQSAVARDFFGIGMNMEDVGNRHGVIGKQNLPPAAEHSLSPLVNNMAMTGIENSAWSKSGSMLQFLPLTGSPDKSFKEQIDENLPERSFPHVVHTLQMQDLASYDQKNGSHTQDKSIRTMTTPSKPEAKAVSGILSTSEMRLRASGVADKQHDLPLTIFYAGSVKVFNNISAEQAEAIMILASTSNAQGKKGDPVAATLATKSINSTATPCPRPLMNFHTNQAAVNEQINENKVSQVTTNIQLDMENLNLPVPSGPVNCGQALVPSALPHARKASLTRFLEKRRERAQSKCPYRVRREDSSLLEERLSSSNDPASHTLCIDRVDKKGLIPSWMERVAECSTSDILAKEQKITTI